MQLFREEDHFHKDTHDILVTVTIALPHAQDSNYHEGFIFLHP